MEQKYVLMFEEKQDEGEFLANLATFSKTPLINENLVKMKGPCKKLESFSTNTAHIKIKYISTNMLYFNVRIFYNSTVHIF